MRLLLFLRYAASCLRYRGPGARRFLRDGLSIDERTRRLRSHWAPHLERSRAAQLRWKAEGSDLAVLGAGRLYDFEPRLARCFRRLLLIDADPSCQPVWSRKLAGLPIKPTIADLTGCLVRWQGALRAVNDGWAETLRRVSSIVQPGPDRPMPFAADAVLSLNLLSQLPIAWQDIVEDHLIHRFGTSYTKARESEWLAAVEPGGRWLVQQHLLALAASGASRILLITDVEFHDHEDGGRRIVVQPALFDVPIVLPGYEMEWNETWMWNICPVGCESAHHGSAHKVAAYSFYSSSRASANPFTGTPCALA